jgi:DNA-binding protein HU-beta
MAKAKPRTKAQIIAHVAETAEITKKQAAAAVECLVATACAGAKDPKGFTIPGLGKLILVKRAARWGRNPATGEKIRIKAKKVVKFRVAKACKDAIIPPKK